MSVEFFKLFECVLDDVAANLKVSKTQFYRALTSALTSHEPVKKSPPKNSESDDEPPKKTLKKPAPKKQESDSSDDEPVKPVKKSIKKSPPKKSESSDDEPVKPVKKSPAKKVSHTCEKILTAGKNKDKPCGKTASYQGSSGKWYCGTIKEDGKSTGHANTDAVASVSTKIQPTKRVLASPKHTHNILDKIKEKKSLEQFAVHRVGEYLMNDETRIVINSETKDAMGQLNSKNELVKLSEENIRICEGLNIPIQTSKLTVVKPASGPDSDDDSEAADESEDESFDI